MTNSCASIDCSAVADRLVSSMARGFRAVEALEPDISIIIDPAASDTTKRRAAKTLTTILNTFRTSAEKLTETEVVDFIQRAAQKSVPSPR